MKTTMMRRRKRWGGARKHGQSCGACMEGRGPLRRIDEKREAAAEIRGQLADLLPASAVMK